MRIDRKLLPSRYFKPESGEGGEEPSKLARHSPDPALCAYPFSSCIVPFLFQGYYNPLSLSHHLTPQNFKKGTAHVMELRLRPVLLF